MAIMLAGFACLVWIVLRPLRVSHHPAIPADGEGDHRFRMPSGWQRSMIPLALRFEPPMGTEHGALTYNAQKFLEMNEKRGGPHLGDDLNGIGGQNTDLGDPVHSVADGLVIYAGVPSPGWGGTVITAHRLVDGRLLHSMYSHLDVIEPGVGELVARGQTIGTVGSARGLYLAHLHFEMRESDAVDLGPGYSHAVMNRLDPSMTIAALRGAADADLGVSPLGVALSADENGVR
jgi:hypothetical protein